MADVNLFELPLWETYVESVLEILREALGRLMWEPDLPEDEPALNRHLCRLVRRVSYELRGTGRGVPDVNFDSCAGPSADAGPARAYEKTRPDLSWSLSNLQAETPGQYVRRFDIECKRLGKPTSSSHVLTSEYYRQGIRRYIEVDHSYGLNADTGAMVAYVQNMEMDDLLAEVNELTRADNVSELTVTAGAFVDGIINDLQHDFARAIHVSPFRLLHIWADFRRSAGGQQTA